MKLTSINGRLDRSGRHNDRNFDIKGSEHINADLTRFNRTWNFSMDDDISFREAELSFYEQTFAEHLERVNEGYLKARKPECVKTMEDYYSSRRSQPEDRIIQIGNYKDTLDPDDLWDLANDYRRTFNERFYPNCQIITMALHVDEATPHIHIRRVWCAADKDGFKHVNQTKALSELGYNVSNSSRYDNAKKQFTCEDRQMLYDIAKDYYSDLDITNPERRIHFDIKSFKLSEAAKTEQRIDDKKNDLEKNTAALIAFYKESGVFNDDRELKEILSLPRPESFSKMHELFMERISSIGGREADLEYLR